MSASWKRASGYSLFFAALFFVFGGTYIPEARRFANAAPSERTVAPNHLSIKRQAVGPLYEIVLHGFRTEDYVCSYEFSIDEGSYRGSDECPELGDINATRGGSVDTSGDIAGAGVTIYYNPADPTMNSLLEFSEASERDYRGAGLWITMGALGLFSAVFGLVLETAKNRGGGREVIDFEGTVISPEEIGSGSEPLRLSNDKAANSNSSLGLRELYLEVVNKIHPDRAASEADIALRERLMKEANAAFERGDTETLRRVLEEYEGATPAS